MAEDFGTSITLEQWDTAPVDWTALISEVYIPGRTLPASSQTFVALNCVPTTPPWPENATILAEAPVSSAFGLVQLVAQPSAVTVTTCRATDNADGTGASYDLAGSASPSRADLFGVYGSVSWSANTQVATLYGVVANPTDHTLYLQAMTGTILRFAAIPHRESVGPPPTNLPPTTPPPPTNLPPTVVQRKLLDAANPGLTCEIERDEHYEDMVELFLGQKVALSIDGVLGRLGIVARSYVVTRLRFRWQVTGATPPVVKLVTQATLEKIPGTLLPGAGTSTTTQDDAGTGAEISLFARWEIAGAGWGSGWAA